MKFRQRWRLPYPDDCRYAESHEYARAEGELVRVGCQRFAVQQTRRTLSLSNCPTWAPASSGHKFLARWSRSRRSKTSMPRSAAPLRLRNEAVLASPEEIQNDPFGEGWLLLVRPSAAAELNDLMDAARYRAKVERGLRALAASLPCLANIPYTCPHFPVGARP